MELIISNVWVICVLALAAGFFAFFFGHKMPLQGASVTIGAMAICFGLSAMILFEIYLHPESCFDKSFVWFSAAGTEIVAGFIVDPLTAFMLVVVTLVSLLVQIYSLGYMHGDKGFTRYFAYVSVFSFAMLLVIVTNNLLILYIGWELVGLCSYLLIGFWYEKQSASDAGKKAFITTKVGDVGFFLGLLMLWAKTHTFHFATLYDSVRTGLDAGTISPSYLAVALILFFGGAVGKSAQFPLHVWLPDAMEGPTPVSALIHSATMVAAGVYLVGRAFPLFMLSKVAILFVAYTGAITAIFAATMALVMNDIKKVLAYSTISQLGFMMLGLGVGGYVSGLFHLVTHAFFKPLLFLGSGSVIHAMHTQDIRNMGGLMKTMRITAITFLLGSISIAGIPPFAGFFSKDAILANVFELVYVEPVHILLLVMPVIAAFMTAFYMFRLFFMTFMGETRDSNAHPHESPLEMTVPLMILALLAVVAGLFANGFDGSLKTPTWTKARNEQNQEVKKLVLFSNAELLALEASEENGENGEKRDEKLGNKHGESPQEKIEGTHGEKKEGKNSGESVGGAGGVRSAEPLFRPELHTFNVPQIPEHERHAIHIGMMFGSVGIALMGILLAYLMYWPPKPFFSPKLITDNFIGAFIHKVLINKYYFDEIYFFVFVGGAKWLGTLLFWFDAIIVDGFVNACGLASWMLSEFQNLIDKYVVDGLVNAVGNFTGYVGRGFSFVQNGFVQSYLMIVASCLLGTLLVMFHYSLF